MSTVFCFGQRIGELSVATRRALSAIARENDAEFHYATGRAFNGAKGWFTARNMGEPFDSNIARAVRTAANAAGLDYFGGES